MKFASFEHDGKPSFGAVIGDRVVDLKVILESRYADLKALLEANALRDVMDAVGKDGPSLALSDVRFLPVIPNPGKIWCAGLNYGDHVRETGREISEKPTFFLRVAESQVGNDQAILRPPESERLDYEGELAVIIGKPGRRITESRSWDHIAGYACYNDASIRDWQMHTSQWCPGKNFSRTGAFGPWMVTEDEIAPDAEMSLVTRLNGVEVQRATTCLLIHSIPRLISYASTILPLSPGDVIVTGTPGGIGAKRSPPLWMKSGDVVEVEIDRIGVLRNPVLNEQD